jgi:hypothetical protein
MINFKMSMPRRSFLRGAGSAIALPLLGAMIPSMTALAKTAAHRPRRVGFVYVPHGMVMTDTVDWWTPSTAGANFEFSRTLKPLEKHRDKVTVVSNLLGATGAGQHAGAATAWLTDSFPKKTDDLCAAAGTSIDQTIAQRISEDTPLQSMQLAIEDMSDLRGFLHTGYSCTYLNTISWDGQGNPLSMQVSPRSAFETMFGQLGAARPQAERIHQRRSILDSVLGEAHQLDSRLDAQDRARVADYLENIRQVERRIQQAESSRETTNARNATPKAGAPKEFAGHVAVMFDLLHLAYQADLTRVFSFMMAREISSVSYPEIGVPETHHAVSHHQNSDAAMTKHGDINRYHVELFSKFVDKLAATPDGDGSILDHTLLMYGSGMSNGNDHVKSRLPVALVSGFVKGNRHIVTGGSTPIGDLHVDIAKQMGVELASFGERSKGGTVGLS